MAKTFDEVIEAIKVAGYLESEYGDKPGKEVLTDIADLAKAWAVREGLRETLADVHSWLKDRDALAQEDHPMYIAYDHVRGVLFEVLTGQPWLDGAGRDDTLAKLREILGEEGD